MLGRNSRQTQSLPQFAQAIDLDANVVNGTTTAVPGWLIIDIQAPGTHCDKYISGTGQVAVEKHFGFQVPTPPLYGRFDIGGEHMDMMQVDCHFP